LGGEAIKFPRHRIFGKNLEALFLYPEYTRGSIKVVVKGLNVSL
jgi:hypothetical protein